jgi:hypothetical protein
MRTAYQGKIFCWAHNLLMFFVYISGVLFEMMAAEIRKKSPETIDDLKKMNFTVIEIANNWEIFYELIEKERR